VTDGYPWYFLLGLLSVGLFYVGKRHLGDRLAAGPLWAHPKEIREKPISGWVPSMASPSRTFGGDEFFIPWVWRNNRSSATIIDALID
jgi:hypothetical protein